MNLSGLYLITDRKAAGSRSMEEVVEAAIAGGVRLIQYREKELSKREAYETALRLRELTRQGGAKFLINDHIDLALAVCADGVHLGQQDFPLEAARKIVGPQMIIGVSARTPELARQADAQGADYVAVGPIFQSPTKQAVPSLGPEAVRKVKQVVSCPVFGIGGINSSNACDVIHAGGDGVAVISALHRPSNVNHAAEELVYLLRGCGDDPKKS